MKYTNKIIQSDLYEISNANIEWNKLKEQKILITGANGLIGSYLVYTLLYLNDRFSLDIEVLALCRNKKRAEERFSSILRREDFRLVVGDVNNKLSIKGSVDYIIHAASQTGRTQFLSDPVGTISVNTIGTMNLLDLAVEKNTKSFLNLSTREIYGKSINDNKFIRENDYGIIDPTELRSAYPESKRVSETICAAYMKQYGIKCKVARISHTYGPEYSRDNGRIWEEFISNVVNGQDIVLKSDGSTELAFTYITDTIIGLLIVLLQGEEFVYNVSNQNSILSVKELAETLIELYPDKKLKIRFDIATQFQGTGYLAHKIGALDSSKAMELGWNPRVGIREGFKRTIESIE